MFKQPKSSAQDFQREEYVRSPEAPADPLAEEDQRRDANVVEAVEGTPGDVSLEEGVEAMVPFTYVGSALPRSPDPASAYIPTRPIHLRFKDSVRF